MKSAKNYILIALISLTVMWPPGVLSQNSFRRLTPEDLFHLQELGDDISPGTSLSPDGKWLAYVVKRPMITAKIYGENRSGHERADVWLVSTKGGQAVNLTNGAVKGVGYWNPVWSPDSQRIALMSSDGATCSLAIFQRATLRLTKFAKLGINAWVSLVWLSDHVIASSEIPEQKKPISLTERAGAVEIAPREWQKTREGKETTANVLDSGISSGFRNRPKGHLFFVDVISGTSQIVGQGDFASIRLSPDRHFLAAIEQVDLATPEATRNLNYYLSKEEVRIFSVDGRQIGLETKPVNLVDTSMSWAMSGAALAIKGKTSDGSIAVYLYRFERNASRIIVKQETVQTDAVGEPLDILWSRNDELILKAKRVSDGSESKGIDWWVIAKVESPRDLTFSMKNPPSQLTIESDRNALIGVADGKLWRIPVDGSAIEQIATDLRGKISSLVWPRSESRPLFGFWPRSEEMPTSTQVIVSSESGANTNFYEIDLSSGDVVQLISPGRDARITAYGSNNRQAVMTADNEDGTFLWLVSAHMPMFKVVEANTYLGEIANLKPKMIEYRSLDGTDLKAWLILPPTYQPGKRFPMVTWVYAGNIYGEREPWVWTQLNVEAALNLQLLAAYGYGVLLPSMPLKPEGEPSDPYLELTKGVLPAVDRAIELGYADANRLGVMGQSFGGYSTYGLVTQTPRFKAAISLAGLSDLVSLYGTFDARARFDDFPQEKIVGQWMFEGGQTRMSNPPWKDWGRYLRNSPIFYVERVQTPLMIVQGDMDYISMHQGEEFFTALYRQGKRARFIRYWGEGHVLSSPANIRDYWMQVYAWLDEFCDISRDANGNLIFDGDHVKPRNGAPALKPTDFARFNEIEAKSHPWIQKSLNTNQ